MTGTFRWPGRPLGRHVPPLLTAAFALAHLGWTLLNLRVPVPVWAGQVFYLGVMYAATLTCALAAQRGGGKQAAWRWIALAVGTYAVADTCFDVLEWRTGAVQTPSVADALYLAFYPLISLGCLALTRQPLRRAEAWRLALDIGIVVGSLGVLLWYSVLAAVLGDAEASLLSKLVNLSYPVFDLCTLGLLLSVMRRSDGFQAAERLLALGLSAFITGDLLYLWVDANAGFLSGSPVEVLWTGGGLLFALAAWASYRKPPPEGPLAAVSRVTTGFGRPLYVLAPYLGLGSCFALLLGTWGQTSLAAHGALWGTATVTLLVALRQAAALIDNAGLTTQLAALNDSLECRVATRTAEVEHGRARMEAQARQLAHQAHHDALTGLPNRAGFLNALEAAVERQRRGEAAPLAVLFLDLDGFKNVNDTLGHTVGDQLLIQVAARLRGAAHPGDFVARLGGDEFMVLTSREPQARAQEVLDLFASPLDPGGRPVQISASVGVSVYPEGGADAESLYMHADVAMYEAKRAGKRAARVFTLQMSQATRSDAELKDHLRGALGRGEYVLHYQPICGPDRRISAFEALLRWQSPDLGLLTPERFLPVAEEIGHGPALGSWVLNEACAQLAQWRTVGHPTLRMAVNISPSQFAHPDFVASVEAALSRHGLGGEALELEVTEDLFLNDRARARAVLSGLRELDVTVSLCGFGSAPSVLAPALDPPVRVLKLARSLVATMGTEQTAADPAHGGPRAVLAMTALAQALQLSVVAEGVETLAQWQTLTELGCERSQGFWLGQPQNAHKALALLAGTTPEGWPRTADGGAGV